MHLFQGAFGLTFEKRSDRVLGWEPLRELVLSLHRRFPVVESIFGYEEHMRHVDECRHPLQLFTLGQRIEGSQDSRLLSYAGWGHTAYDRSECTTEFIDAYLLNGALPPKGTVCPANPNPFLEEARSAALSTPKVGLPQPWFFRQPQHRR